ncbi:MAG: dihydroxy-acid dehydratase, partial [Rhizobium pusense]|nr:dihydroxy-acid dehydratase [Agrobacterium pusense]
MTDKKLRSDRWFAPDDLRSFGHRSRMMQLGYAEEDFIGKPVIGILNTWSELNTCHSHFPERVQDVKRGVLQAGGFPVEMPSLSVDESFTKPTSMLYRNMLAMETEEMIRSHPLDGVVLMGGCDKRNYAGKVLGSGSDAWKYWDERRAGNVTDEEWRGVQGGIARSAGVCMTMGTASTMTAIADALGITLPGASSIPAVDSEHQRMSAACGRRIVEMVSEDLTPNRILTAAAFRNAAIVAMATGCSTNAVVHLIAMARRAGVPMTLDELDELGRVTPLIANVRPSGKDYLMQDFFYAGGLRALMKQLESRLDCSVLTVTGRSMGENLEGAKVYNDDVIRSLDNPVYAEGSLAVLRGNLCPDGAVIKPAACDPKLHIHQGPALVFDSYPEMKAAIDDENLDVTPDHVLVLRNAGPLGGPGFPEWGMLPIPKALIKKGHRD